MTGRIWPWRRRQRLADLEEKLAHYEQALTTLEDACAALTAKLAQREQDLDAARQLHSRLQQQINHGEQERSESEKHANRLRYAVQKHQDALGELEDATATAATASTKLCSFG